MEMSMSQHGWYGAAAGYLGMWMAMMVPMMLPALIPMLSRYRRSVCGVERMQLHGLTVLVGAGYFAVWAGLGAATYAGSVSLMAAEMRWGEIARWLPAATGLLLVAAGAVQLTPWKARQLGLCRTGAGCRGAPASNAAAAWRHGWHLGVQCSLCCTGLMLALVTVGMMNLVATAAVTLVISAERLAPVPLRVARIAGVTIVMLGVLTIAGR
jgi:predicted metal-binding membrane protein